MAYLHRFLRRPVLTTKPVAKKRWAHIPFVDYAYFDPPSATATGQVVAPDDIAAFDGVLALSPVFNADSFSGDDRLAVIGRWGVGYDRIDVDACTRAGVLLAIATDAVRRPVAEAVVTLALALAKCMFEKDRIVRQGRWDRRGASPAQDLYGKTLGMVGLGNIGADVFRLLEPFALGRRLAYDPYVRPEDRIGAGRGAGRPGYRVHASRISSPSTRPLTAQTRGLVDARLLGLMKPTAYLINTAPRPVVVQDDLIAALQTAQHRRRRTGCVRGRAHAGGQPADPTGQRDPRAPLAGVDGRTLP